MNIGIIGTYYTKDIHFLGKMKNVNTKFGKATVNIGKYKNNTMVFLQRHGKSNEVNPNLINHKANMAALKKQNVEVVLSIHLVGSLKHNINIGDIVIPTDFICLNKTPSFYDNSSDPHFPDMKYPYCPKLRKMILRSMQQLKIWKKTGVYFNITGPRLETKSERIFFENAGGDIVGMTDAYEASLAREMGMCYSSICLVTDKAGEEITISKENLKQLIRNRLVKLLDLSLEELSTKKIGNCKCYSYSHLKGEKIV